MVGIFGRTLPNTFGLLFAGSPLRLLLSAHAYVWYKDVASCPWELPALDKPDWLDVVHVNIMFFFHTIKVLSSSVATFDITRQ